jgi:hypothetical protein
VADHLQKGKTSKKDKELVTLERDKETVDIFRDHGPAWRSANAGHVSLDQLKVMSAIEDCRTICAGRYRDDRQDQVR